MSRLRIHRWTCTDRRQAYTPNGGFRDATWQAAANKSRAGVISMILCFAVGIANIVMFWKIVTVVFGAICLSVPPFGLTRLTTTEPPPS